MRWLGGSIADWDAIFAEAFNTLRPGGWLESFEASINVESDHGGIPEESCLKQFSELFVQGGKKLGRTFLVVDEDLQKKAMEKAGFIDIQTVDFKVSWSAYIPLGIQTINALLAEAARTLGQGPYLQGGRGAVSADA